MSETDEMSVWPDEAREDVRDALSGWPIGSGYYSSSVSVDDARELMALAFTALTPHVEAMLDQARAEVDEQLEVGGAEWTRMAEQHNRLTGERDAAIAGARRWKERWAATVEDATQARAERDDLAARLAAVEAERDRRLRSTVKAALLAAWDDGNAMGLDGWVGPERGEEPDEHAIRSREQYVRKALDRMAGGA